MRKAEQGGTVRMETLHTLARGLGVTTAALMASDAPEPVGRAEEPNRVNLIQLRAALTPAVGLVDQDAQAVAEEPNLRIFRRTLQDARVLYFSDSYKSVAAQLPGLLRDAAQAVAYYAAGMSTGRPCWPAPRRCVWPAPTSPRYGSTTSRMPLCVAPSWTPVRPETCLRRALVSAACAGCW